jgi:hypothetical protein
MTDEEVREALRILMALWEQHGGEALTDCLVDCHPDVLTVLGGEA